MRMRIVNLCFLWLLTCYVPLSAKEYSFSEGACSVLLLNETLTFENDDVIR